MRAALAIPEVAMDYVWLLSGFKGRINRARYLVVQAALLTFWLVWLKFEFQLSSQWQALHLDWVAAITMIWINAATTVKRLHDRNRSGWWAAAILIVNRISYLYYGLFFGLYFGVDISTAKELLLVMLAVALSIALWSQPGDWFRRPWSNPYNPTISKSLEQPATYLLLDKPLAYAAPLLPPQSRFYQLADIAMPIMADGEFDRRIRAALKTPLPGGAWELHTRGKPIREPLLERYGLRVDASRPCVEIEGAQLTTAIEVCPLASRAR